jgi:hypothetical protein
MGKFGKELIESMQQAARHAAGKRVQAKEIKQRHRTFATAELSDKRVKAMAPHAWTRGMRVSTPSLSRSSTSEANFGPSAKSLLALASPKAHR